MLTSSRTRFGSRLRFFSSKSFDLIPGPKSLPKTGTFAEFIERVQQTDILQAYESYYYQYGPLVKHDFMGKNEVWCFSPDYAINALRQEGPYPNSSSATFWPQHEFNATHKLSYDVLTAGPAWQKHRRQLQKDMFSPSVAQTYLPLLNEPAKYAASLAPLSDNLAEFTPFVAMDLFFSAMLGYNPSTVSVFEGKEVDSEDINFAKNGVRAMQLAVGMFLDPLAYHNRGDKWKEYERCMDQHVASCRNYIANLALKKKLKAEEQTQCYFSRLLGRKELSRKGAEDALVNFLFAGVDTTHHLLLWVLLNLARNPDKQNKLRDELFSVLGDGPLEAAHLADLHYLNACIRESHRLTPTAPFLTSRTFPQDIEIGGYKIPTGVRVFFISCAVQRDPAIVENADCYIPERWAPEAVELRKGTKQEALDNKVFAKPFSYGPRMCIGSRLAEMELKAFLCHLLREWEFVADAHQPYKVVLKTMTIADPFPKLMWKSLRESEVIPMELPQQVRY